MMIPRDASGGGGCVVGDVVDAVVTVVDTVVRFSGTSTMPEWKTPCPKTLIASSWYSNPVSFLFRLMTTRATRYLVSVSLTRAGKRYFWSECPGRMVAITVRLFFLAAGLMMVHLMWEK